MAEGVDYAWARPSVAGLVAAGKRFVVRYGGPGSDGKQLDAAELRALLAAGISVVANAEGSATGFKGRAAGAAWARDAEQHFRGLGMPAGRPIYFSVDWNAGTADWPAVDAALRGAAEVIGAARVGVYGGYNTIRHCQSAGTARWFWQTYAWSNGRWASGAHLQQYRNHVSLAGGTVDLCRSMTADYGQWGTEDEMTPAEMDALLTRWHDLNLGSAGPTVGVALQRSAGYGAALATISAKLDALAATGDDATLARIEQTHQDAMQRLTDMEAREQARDAENLAALKAALPAGTDPVSREELEAALATVYGRAFGTQAG